MKNQIHDSDLRTFSGWLREIGRSRATGWRWRRRGWIATVNIGGQWFVTREAIERFNARAARGEFARASKTPHGRTHA